MNKIQIKIAGELYQVKMSFRSLMLFEEMTGKSVDNASGISDIMKIFYCIIKACNKTFTSTLDEFIDLIDDNPESLEVFTDFLNNQNPEDNTPKKKKK